MSSHMNSDVESPPDIQDDESDEDAPLITKKRKTKPKAQLKSDIEDEDKPLITVLKKRKSKKLKQNLDDDAEDEYESLFNVFKKRKKIKKKKVKKVKKFTPWQKVTKWKCAENFADACGYCEQTCIDLDELKDHLLEIHGATKNKCMECKKEFNFSKPSALQSHKKLGENFFNMKNYFKICPIKNVRLYVQYKICTITQNLLENVEICHKKQGLK